MGYVRPAFTSKRAALLASAIACVAAPAIAQETGASSTPNETTRSSVDGENLIIVTARNYVPDGSMTATKTSIPLIETPQSVSVITRDQIDLLNFVDAQQAVRYTAGVSGENYGPDLRFDFITVRGFTPKQFIDGLATPVTTTIFSVGVDLYGFETMDILKGPSSVLYGSVPPGGIYNQTSRRASSDFGGELQVKYGEDDYKQLAGTLTGPVNDMIDARFTALYRDRDAERDFVHARRFLGAPTVTLKLGERTKLTGLLYYQYDEVNGDTNGFLPVYGTLLPNPNGKVDRSINLGEPDYNRYERRQFAAGFDFEHAFSDALSFHSNAKWSEYKERSVVIYGAGLDTDLRTVFRSSFPYNEDVFSFAADNRLDATLTTGSVEHKILVGVDYRNVFNNAAYGFGSAPSIDLFDPEYGVGAPYETPAIATRYNEQRLKQTGVYFQDQLKFGNFYLSLGGRHDWVRSRYVPPFTSVTVDGPIVKERQKKFTYRVGANYVSESGVAPYISYATSFEPVLGADLEGDAFKPSTGKQIEGGIKYDARNLGDDVRLFATAAVFKINQSNVVSTASGPLPAFGTQSGKVEVYGGEVELVARIREQLTINASYSYTHSEVTENDNAPVEVGEPLPVTPKHKASLFVDYTVQRGSLGGLGFGGGVRYAGKSAGSLPGFFNPVVFYGEDPVLFDAIVHYDTPGWRFAVNGSNIFDKRYVARCASASNCTFGAGRQVIGTVTKKF